MSTLSRVTIVSAAVLAIGAAAIATPATAEWNVDLYVGPTYSHDDTEAGELTLGGRVGYFFPSSSRLNFGLFADSSIVLDDDGGSTARDFTFVPTTALGLLRYRLVETEGFALHPYLGAGPSAVWSKLEVGKEDDTAVDLGLDARLGLRAIVYERFAAFVEYRLNYFDTDYDLARRNDSVHVDDVYHAALMGIGYRFVSPPPPPAPAPPMAAEPQVEVEERLPAPTKKRIVLRGVTFDFDGADLSGEARGTLDAAVAVLRDSPDSEVIVAGHTDSVGSDTYNMRLSERRATRVRDYLVGQGIDAGRLSVRAYGESQPVADNDTAEGRAQNRRVELNVAE